MKKFFSLTFLVILSMALIFEGTNCAFAAEKWIFTNNTSDLVELNNAFETALKKGLEGDAIAIYFCKNFLEDGYTNQIIVVANEGKYSYDVGYYDIEIGYNDNSFGLITENMSYVVTEVDNFFYSYWTLAVKEIAEELNLYVKVN